MKDILQGTWHLIYSNFNMWKKDGVNNITFNYTPVQQAGTTALLDEVKYHDNGKLKKVVGYDFPYDDSKFTWRGKGLLFLLKSKWQVEWMSADKNCLVLSFEKTLFTPAGVDIIARDKKPTVALLQQAREIIQVNERLHALAAGLTPID